MKLSYEELEAKFVANRKFLVKSQGDLEQSRESQRQTQKILDRTLRILQETQKNLKETQGALKNTQKALEQALKKISKLEEKCNLNSKNSSKPPSSDQKPSGKSPKQKFKKNGAKPGRCGYFWPTFTQGEVDQFIDVEVQKCPTCKGSVKFAGKELIHQSSRDTGKTLQGHPI